MLVNEAGQLGGAGQRTKMRTSLHTAPQRLLPPAPAPGWKLLPDSLFLPLKVSPASRHHLFGLKKKKDLFLFLGGFFSLNKRLIKFPWMLLPLWPRISLAMGLCMVDNLHLRVSSLPADRQPLLGWDVGAWTGP